MTGRERRLTQKNTSECGPFHSLGS